jgi:hypothetical protein
VLQKMGAARDAAQQLPLLPQTQRDQRHRREQEYVLLTSDKDLSLTRIREQATRGDFDALAVFVRLNTYLHEGDIGRLIEHFDLIWEYYPAVLRDLNTNRLLSRLWTQINVGSLRFEGTPAVCQPRAGFSWDQLLQIMEMRRQLSPHLDPIRDFYYSLALGELGNLESAHKVLLETADSTRRLEGGRFNPLIFASDMGRAAEFLATRVRREPAGFGVLVPTVNAWVRIQNRYANTPQFLAALRSSREGSINIPVRLAYSFVGLQALPNDFPMDSDHVRDHAGAGSA